MSETTIGKKALDEIAEAARNLLEAASRNGADLYFAFGGPAGGTGLYAVPTGKWKRIVAATATEDESDNSLCPSQGFFKVPVGLEYLDERDETLVDLEP